MTKYRLFTIKRYLEQFIMFPFVLLGKLYATLYPLKESYDIFFFFPTYAIGGAERVNAEIAKSFPDKKCIIFFTKKSPNDGMKHFFEMPHVKTVDISKWTDNKWIYFLNFFYRGVCSGYINKSTSPAKVFIGHCTFGYKVTPFIKKKVLICDLLHMYNDIYVWIWAPFIRFIDKRVLVGDVFIKNFSDCYKKNGIPTIFIQRMKVIFYCLEYLPGAHTVKSFSKPLKIYYAGRGGPQKRVWLIVKIIEKCIELKLPVQFKLAGPIEQEIPAELKSNDIYVGKLSGGEQMYTFHKENEVLLMTSAWEGFPLAIMEAMSFSSIPLVPAIDAIPEHIQDGVNGFLIENINNENDFVNCYVDRIKELCADKFNLENISKNAYFYAINNFSEENFRKEYRELLLN